MYLGLLALLCDQFVPDRLDLGEDDSIGGFVFAHSLSREFDGHTDSLVCRYDMFVTDALGMLGKCATHLLLHSPTLGAYIASGVSWPRCNRRSDLSLDGGHFCIRYTAM